MKKETLDARLDIRLSSKDKDKVAKDSKKAGFKSVNKYVVNKLVGNEDQK